MENKLEEILTIKDLEIGFRSGKKQHSILPPLNAHACKGELIALIGKNGIGKSTLLKTLAGLQPSLGGEIIYDGINLNEHSRIDLARKVGFISTEIIKVSNMTVYDLVALGRFPHTNWIGRIDKFNNDVILDAIEKTGIQALCNRPISELSDGERQRAMIARILAQDTGIMIMDEPTAFLDIGSKFEILHLMHTLSGKNGKTIIFSTHDLHLALSESDKIWLIINNKLIEGAPEDLMIRKAFDHLFDPSPVKISSENGMFSFIMESKGYIKIEGKGNLRHWTEKAVVRAGFSVSDKISFPLIRIPGEGNKNWIYITETISLEFDSLYSLVGWLNKDHIEST